jgi:4-hydroxy-tetrahydrodipicolinate synthase
MKTIKKYHGVIPPIITPVDENERVDEEGFRKLLEHCVEKGLHGIFVAGTNGETMALTQAERNRAIKIALDQVGGTCAVITSIFYARHTSQNETIRHFEKISRETALDLVIYNMPSMTGITLSADTVISIAGFDHVKAYKDSSGDFPGFLKVLGKLRGTPFSCLQGITSLAVPALLMGADGFVPALGPLFPEIFTGAFLAAGHENPETEKAWYWDGLIGETSKILTLSKNQTASAKYAISHLGFTDEQVLMPQDGVSPEEKKAIIAQIEKVKQLS